MATFNSFVKLREEQQSLILNIRAHLVQWEAEMKQIEKTSSATFFRVNKVSPEDQEELVLNNIHCLTFLNNGVEMVEKQDT